MLSRMSRAYQLEHVLPTIRLIRERCPKVSVTTQIIVAFRDNEDGCFFPHETKEYTGRGAGALDVIEIFRVTVQYALRDPIETERERPLLPKCAPTDPSRVSELAPRRRAR